MSCTCFSHLPGIYIYARRINLTYLWHGRVPANIYEVRIYPRAVFVCSLILSYNSVSFCLHSKKIRCEGIDRFFRRLFTRRFFSNHIFRFFSGNFFRRFFTWVFFRRFFVSWFFRQLIFSPVDRKRIFTPAPLPPHRPWSMLRS